MLQLWTVIAELEIWLNCISFIPDRESVNYTCSQILVSIHINILRQCCSVFLEISVCTSYHIHLLDLSKKIGGLLMKMLLSLSKLECSLISTKSFSVWYLLKWLFVCKCPRLTRVCFLVPILVEAEISQADSSQPGQINRLHCLIPRGVCDCFIVHDDRGIPF